jgi:hypothetical protein
MQKVYTVLGIMLLVAGASTVAMAAPAPTTPEIDPGMAGSGIALVSGMLLLIRGRRKK